jgi:hypothetical protein
MSYFIEDDHEQAIKYFNEAYSRKPGSRIREAILECKRAQEAAEGMELYELRQQQVAKQAEEPKVARHEAPGAGDGAGDGAEDAEVVGHKAPRIEGEAREDAGSRSESPRGATVASASSSGAESMEERLQKLKALFDKGLLTKDDYEVKKQEILADL